MLPRTCRLWSNLYEPFVYSPTRVEPSHYEPLARSPTRVEPSHYEPPARNNQGGANQSEPPARILTQDFSHLKSPARNHHGLKLHYKPPARKMIQAYPKLKALTTRCAKILKIATCSRIIAWHSLSAARKNCVVDRLVVTTHHQAPLVPRTPFL